jgi:glycosyltransferase involved in cell wall biosynthesis|tara:strand:+ start:606 stop:1238 length:633 start_codon:yes stop_codon:yes gene_type:complete
MSNNKFTIHVISVAFERLGELKVFVQSWLNQTENNWKLTVIHDGKNDKFNEIMEDYKKQRPDQIEYYSTEKRYNDYGHSLRDQALKKIKGEYVLLSNCDNYFVPKAMKYINEALSHIGSDLDVLMFNMVHSHQRKPNEGKPIPSYSPLNVEYARNAIDVSSAIVKKELAEQVGFRDKTFAGDATYFEDIYKIKKNETKIGKIARILLVHN